MNETGLFVSPTENIIIAEKDNVSLGAHVQYAVRRMFLNAVVISLPFICF